MWLDERKDQILSAIMELYARTGEPVGSKLLSEYFGVSSATIRNEMAALEKHGFLEQPHTSAGRIPSSMGYRYYLDNLMDKRVLSTTEKKAIDNYFDRRNPDPEKVLDYAAELLASISGYASVRTNPKSEHITAKQFTFVPMGGNLIAVLCVLSSGVLEKKICRLDFPLTDEDLDILAQFAEKTIVGKPLDDNASSFLQIALTVLGDRALSYAPILQAIADILSEASTERLHLHGQSNLFRFKEVSSRMQQLLEMFDKGEEVLSLVNPQAEVNVIMGDEVGNEDLKGTSIVTAKYQIGDDAYGVIGLLGPMRMDYKSVIPHLQYFAQIIGHVLGDDVDIDTEKEETGGPEDGEK